MRRKRLISAEQVVRDVRAGITEQELQQKYNLPDHRVRKLFQRLVAAKAVTGSELAEMFPAYKETFASIVEREEPRVGLEVQFIVYDITTSSLGLVRDISEKGLRVAGIDCQVGDERTFQLPVDTFMQADPLLVVARCKWVKNRGKTRRYVTAGFEIIGLSPHDAKELRNFVAWLLGVSGEGQQLGWNGKQGVASSKPATSQRISNQDGRRGPGK